MTDSVPNPRDVIAQQIDANRKYALGHPSRRAIYVDAQDEAYDILNALADAGLVVVPSEPGEGIQKIANRLIQVYGGTNDAVTHEVAADLAARFLAPYQQTED